MYSSKKFLFLFALFVVLVIGFVVRKQYISDDETLPPPYPLANTNGDPIMGVFEGRTPCLECGEGEKMKVALVLYEDSETKIPTSYWLGIVVVGDGEGTGHRIETEGNLIMTRGIKDYPNAVVYELDFNSPSELRFYWQVNDGILLPLEESRDIKVGNASWGYMLSRVR